MYVHNVITVYTLYMYRYADVQLYVSVGVWGYIII